MFYLVDNTARLEASVKKSSSWGEGLPVFVRVRMEQINVRPTLRQLAALSGVAPMTLHRNFTGERAMHWETAKKLAVALQVSLDELANHSLISSEELPCDVSV